MGFILDGLDTEDYDRTYSDKELIRRIWLYFSDYKKKMLLVAAMLTLRSFTGSLTPVLIAKTVDIAASKGSITEILIYMALIIGAGSFGWFCTYVRQKITSKVTGNIVLNLRSKVFSNAIGFDLSFFDEQSSGKMISRIVSDTQVFSHIIEQTVDFLSQSIIVIVLLVWLFTINAGLTLMLLAMTPIAILIALSFRKAARKVTKNSQQVSAKINAEIKESISGIMVAKTFRMEKKLFSRFTGENKSVFSTGLKRGLVLNLIFPIISLAALLSTAAIQYIGGYFVFKTQMTPGSWYLFIMAVGYFWWPLLNIASFWSQLQDGFSAAERIFSLMDKEKKVVQTGQEKMSELEGRIQFKNVGFSYNENETVLDNFSLSIEPGETIALVGHTGAGKSSIANLIMRFYEFQQGTLLIDKKDIRSLDLSSYRKHIGYISQDPFLFSGTIADNIKYGHPEATEEEILYAATHVGEGDWVRDLPGGIHTEVGSRGSSISMGQRQLVALARVLLKNPSILILDEATASVDPFTEVQIQEGLETVLASRTSLVIAHRLSTIKKADRILVLEMGKIVEEGNHKNLLESGGKYANLYNTYFKHQSLDFVESTFKTIT